MSSAIENAKRRLDELTKEIEEIQLFIALHERYATLSTGPNPDAEVSSEMPVGRKQRRSRGEGLTPKGIVELVERLIREAGKPLTRGDIIDALEARQVDLPGQDKPRYIGTIMWRNKSKFQQIEGLGYWLRGLPWPLPPAGRTYRSSDRMGADDEITGRRGKIESGQPQGAMLAPEPLLPEPMTEPPKVSGELRELFGPSKDEGKRRSLQELIRNSFGEGGGDDPKDARPLKVPNLRGANQDKKEP
jgi:hypothetical protein